ncbi:restriction endonuclease subunit S [Streptomyces sp. NPDC091217]|uniref:restriction endonuclease subunit S n=1 Tax=Streptomyces sp. NPDC091217 TaxID=3365975 RepID=UPI0037FF6891
MNGTLPAGWTVAPLGDLARVYSGGTPSRSVPAYWGGEIPWVTTAEIDSGIVTSARETITDAGLKASAARIAPPGTLLLAMYGQGKTRGKVAALQIPAAMNQACAAIEVGNQLDSRYLFFYLTSRYEKIRSMSNAGSQENLSGELVRRIPITVPPIREQRAIAALLGDADDLTAELEWAIAKKRAIKQGLLRQLLTDKTRLSSWPRLEIGRIAEPCLGGNYRNTESVSGRPLIKMGNIARVGFDLSRIEYIPDTETVSSSHRLRYGDVLFNTRNTLDLVGKVSVWRDELPVAYYNSNILRLEFKSEYCGDSRYFGYALNSAESIKGIRNLATGTTSVAAVYTRDLLKLRVPVPPKSEQRAIVDTLEDADRLISSLECLIAKKQAIKQGMTQQLLTCRTRLPARESTA